jgi:hypothetical protein
MYSQTVAALEKFDNQHDFERMCADILVGIGYKDHPKIQIVTVAEIDCLSIRMDNYES